MNAMEQSVRIRISGGLLFAAALIACLHAATMATMFDKMSRQVDYHAPSLAELPPLLTNGPNSIVTAPPIVTPPVNISAQQEIKQQCLNCPPLPSYPSNVVIPSGQPTLAPPIPRSAQVTSLPEKQYQLLLFVDSSPQSQRLLQWFNTDKNLVNMRAARSTVNVQTYAPGDPMYRARYATTVPVSEFPAVILTDKDGGHIHAAAKQFIPSTAAELYRDLLKGAELYKQAQAQRPANATMSGAIKTRGYSWDNTIQPTMQLPQSGADCVGPYCPQPNQPNTPADDRWHPGSRIVDLLDGKDAIDPIQAVVWANWQEIAIIVLLAVFAGVVYKRLNA